MLTADTTMELGRLCSPDAATGGPRHRLLYLADRQMIVLPFSRAAGSGWHCAVVATRTLRQARHVTLSGPQIAAACPTITVRPEQDPDG